MKSRLPERVQDVPLDALDVGDRSFATTPDWLLSARLVESIRMAGVLSPLRVQERGDGCFRIVNGFRRASAARAASLDGVPCLVHGMAEGPALDLFLGALRENLGSREFDELERSLAIAKLTEQFGISEAEMIGAYLPLLGLRPDRHHLRQAQRIARLPVELQRALPDLVPEVALRLAAWKQPERRLFVDLADRLRLGRNRQREVFELLDELKAVGSRPEEPGDVVRVWKESGAFGIDHDHSMAPAEKLARILEVLRGRRFPALTRAETRAKELKSGLRLPPEIQLNPPRFFEGDRIAIQFQIRSPDDLRRLSRKLVEIAESNELKELFELL